jgi:hypothetical protein
MSAFRLRLLVVLLVVGASPAARAETVDGPVEPPAAARVAADDDTFTPGLTHAVAHGRGLAVAATNYSGAAHKTTVDLAGEIQVYGPVRLVLRVDNLFDKGKPGIGAGVQWLDEAKHGVSSSAYFVYRTEGFTEAEGELEGLVSFAKHLGPVHGTLNLAYGQDPEGVERDGEVAVGLHVEPVAGLYTGVIGRFRDALGSNGDKATGVLRDALAGLSATYVVGGVGITATAGIAGIKTVTAGSQAGPAAALSVGTVF